MKNIVSLFTVLATFFVMCTSCNSDEDPIDNEPEEPVVKEQGVNT